MSNDLDFTTVTIKVKKQYCDGKPCCFGCQFHYNAMFLDKGRVCICALLDTEIGSAYELEEASTPLKTCPVHYPEVTKELLKLN